MRLKRWIPCVLGLVALLFSVATEASGDAASLLARWKAVSGGVKWDALKSLQITGTQSSGGLSGDWHTTQDVVAGRFAESSQSGTFVLDEGYDGHIAWRRDRSGEIALLDGSPALRRARTTAWLIARAYWYPQRAGAHYSTVQSRPSDGHRYDVLTATPAGGDSIELWFEAESGLLARIVQPAASGSALTYRFDDYREVDGLHLPHRVTTDTTDGAGRTDPRLRSELRLQRYALNTGAGDADFAPPPMPTNARVDNRERVTRIPFDLVNNHVYVDASVDGKPVRLLVDTGAVNLLTPAAVKRLGLLSAGKFSVSGVGDSDPDLGFARGKSLRVGDAILSDPVFYVVDLGQQPDAEGVPYDGYIGYEMFRRFGTTFDYARRVLTFAEPARYRPPPGAKMLKFEQDDRAPIFAGTLDGLPLRLWIDSGSRSSLSLFSPFVRTHKLVEKYHASESAVVGWGIGGPARARPARLGALTIGDLAIKGLAGDLSTTDDDGMADPDLGAILGGGVLRRFAFGLDYATKRIYLAPNAEMTKLDPFDRSGLWLQADGDALRVAEVASNSAAAHTLLRENDRIVAIAGEAVGKRSLSDWRERLREQPVGTRVAIEFQRDGKTDRAELVLADRIPPTTAGN